MATATPSPWLLVVLYFSSVYYTGYTEKVDKISQCLEYGGSP